MGCLLCCVRVYVFLFHAVWGEGLLTNLCCLLRVVNENLIPAWIRAHAKSRLPNDLLDPTHAVPANANEMATIATTTATGRSKRPRYSVAAMGGTFDHLHAGHKILLSMAAWIAEEKLIVGVTGTSAKSFAPRRRGAAAMALHYTWVADRGKGADDPLLVKKAYREVLESIDIRIAAVREFLGMFKRAVKYDIVPITDVYGPTASDSNIQVLIVSRETLSGANASEFIQISCET